MKALSLKNYDYLFWDLDGTLTASAPGIINSVKYALESFGIHEEDESKLLLFVGPPLIESFQKFYGFSEEIAWKAQAKYRERFGEKGIFENSVFEGIKEVLKELKSAGKHLAVATAKPEIYMKPILDYFELREYFDFACGADVENGRAKKEQVIDYLIKTQNLQQFQTEGKILMIGDRNNDIEGAHANGIPCCAVLWGYGSKEEFEKYSADYVIETPSDLLHSL